MQRANISFVSLGIFSWSWLEPAKGEYEFEWLDTIMDKLHAGGIAVDLATATATPPPWLSAAHPEILPVDVDGHTLWPGSRQAWCPTSPVFREYGRGTHPPARGALPRPPRPRDVARLQRVRVPQPAVLLRRVRAPLPHLAAPALRGARRAQRRVGHGLLEPALHRLGARSCPPRRSTTFNNPTHVLDYKRFSSDALLEHMRAERAVLDELSPGVPVDDELHDPRPLPPPRLHPVDPHGRRRQHRPLHRRLPQAPARRARLQRRPHPRPGRRRARGCSWSTRRARSTGSR